MTLTDNLVSYWKLDEMSGTRYDATALPPISRAVPNDLTDNNSVLYGTGADAKIVNSAAFVAANSQSLTLANSETKGLSPTGSLSISLWMKGIPGTGIDMGLVDQGQSNISGYMFYLYNVNVSTFYLVYLNRTTGSPYIQQVWTPFPDGSTWYHLAVVYDNSAQTVQFYVDGVPMGTPISETYSPGLESGSTFGIGLERAFSPLPLSYYNGYIDEVGFWDRVLTSAEVETLYNSGRGLTYPFLPSFSPFPSHYNT